MSRSLFNSAVNFNSFSNLCIQLSFASRSLAMISSRLETFSPTYCLISSLSYLSFTTFRSKVLIVLSWAFSWYVILSFLNLWLRSDSSRLWVFSLRSRTFFSSSFKDTSRSILALFVILSFSTHSSYSWDVRLWSSWSLSWYKLRLVYWSSSELRDADRISFFFFNY